MEDFESFFELENWIQSKMINDRYSAYIDLMSETYSVYDHEKQENVGDFYELEVEDLLNQKSGNSLSGVEIFFKSTDEDN